MVDVINPNSVVGAAVSSTRTIMRRIDTGTDANTNRKGGWTSGGTTNQSDYLRMKTMQKIL
jgi:hypothetical protein